MASLYVLETTLSYFGVVGWFNKILGQQPRRNVYKKTTYNTYLFTLGVMISDPFLKSRAPVFDHVGFCIFDALTITKTTLSFGRRDHMHRLQIDLNPFLWFGGRLFQRAPGTSKFVCPHPAKAKYSTIRTLQLEQMLKKLNFILNPDIDLLLNSKKRFESDNLKFSTNFRTEIGWRNTEKTLFVMKNYSSFDLKTESVYLL